MGSKVKTHVGYAKLQDLPRVTELAYMGLKEIGEDPDMKYLADAIEVNYWLTPVICLFDKNDIVGVVPLKVSCSVWNNKSYLSSIVYYVLPAYRNFDSIKKITTSIKDVAILHGLPYKDTYMSADKLDARRKLVSLCGFKETGISMEFKSG